jgi:hypothetical protein
MKEMILVCDRCTVSVPAVTTLTLGNGKGKPLSLDLCKKHQLELYKLFTPTHVGKSNPISDDTWHELLESTLKYVVKQGPTTPLAIAQETGLPRWRVGELLKELVKEKKLHKTGVGRSIRYQKGK